MNPTLPSIDRGGEAPASQSPDRPEPPDAHLPPDTTAAAASPHDRGGHPPALDALAQVGRELAEPLTAALERVTTLTTTGRWDPHSLRALRESIAQARQAGIVCQQIARLAQGHIRPTPEHLLLDDLLQQQLDSRAHTLSRLGVQVRTTMQSVPVQADPSLLFTLCQALLDGCIDLAPCELHMTLQAANWPVQATWQCRVVRPTAPSAPTPTLLWYLVDEAARCLGLDAERDGDAHSVTWSFTFPAASQMPLPDALPLPSADQRPVLVLTRSADLQSHVCEILRGLGRPSHALASVRELALPWSAPQPVALIHDQAARCPSLERNLSLIRAEWPHFVVIELAGDDRSFDISSLSGSGKARVGLGALPQSLPKVLQHELAHQSALWAD